MINPFLKILNHQTTQFFVNFWYIVNNKSYKITGNMVHIQLVIPYQETIDSEAVVLCFRYLLDPICHRCPFIRLPIDIFSTFLLFQFLVSIPDYLQYIHCILQLCSCLYHVNFSYLLAFLPVYANPPLPITSNQVRYFQLGITEINQCQDRWME